MKKVYQPVHAKLCPGTQGFLNAYYIKQVSLKSKHALQNYKNITCCYLQLLIDIYRRTNATSI